MSADLQKIVRHSESERSTQPQDGDEVCHFDRSEERAKWRNLAVDITSNERQDFSTTKFVETNFSATHELFELRHSRGRYRESSR